MSVATKTAGAATENFAKGVQKRWGDANNFTKGYLNPTAIGMGAGMVAGGAVGGFSDNGSVVGGALGGAFLGAGMGAGGYAGRNLYKFSQWTNPAYSPMSSQPKALLGTSRTV